MNYVRLKGYVKTGGKKYIYLHCSQVILDTKYRESHGETALFSVYLIALVSQ